MDRRKVVSAVEDNESGLQVWINRSLRKVKLHSTVDKLGPSLGTIDCVKSVVCSILNRLERVATSESGMLVEFSFVNGLEEVLSPPNHPTHVSERNSTRWFDKFLELMEKLAKSAVNVRVSMNRFSLLGYPAKKAIPESDIFSSLNIVLNCERRSPLDYFSPALAYRSLNYLGIAHSGEKLSVSMCDLAAVFINTPRLRTLKLSNIELVANSRQTVLWNIPSLEVLEIEDTTVSVELIPKPVLPVHTVIFRTARDYNLESFTRWTVGFDFPNLSLIEYRGHRDNVVNRSIVSDLINSPLFKQATEFKSIFFHYPAHGNMLSAPRTQENYSLKHLHLTIVTPEDAEQVFASLYNFRELKTLTLSLSPCTMYSWYPTAEGIRTFFRQSLRRLPPESEAPALKAIVLLHHEEAILTVKLFKDHYTTITP
ncbi:hypothetical protein TRICI_003193 [Trichomonascus ciferrii]|uniref:F-box domain-containing protein n=1 Tax=Trichomonascus ciferrii TaxID=44093 RepID=A0A642VAP4_9ASCO|nr:hypothetical protein TRICI_003193 [Trichomonascus ciferrii]